VTESHHLPPFRPSPPADPGKSLGAEDRGILSETITILAELRMDLAVRREYAVKLEIQLREQDRRLELAYSRLLNLLRKEDATNQPK